MIRYFGGAPFHQGTNLPSNVTGECKHFHRTPAAAQKCIDQEDAAIKRGHGRTAYSDRIVMVQEGRRQAGRWIYAVGTTRAWTDLNDEA